MKRLLLTTALLGAVGASPALAADTALTMWNSTNPGGAETALGTGSADLASQNLGGITVTLSFVNRSTSPNDLTEGNIAIVNTTGTVQTLDITAGANGYLGPSSAFNLSGTIGATLGTSELTGSFFVDPLNTLNGQNTGPVVGTFLNGFDSGLLPGPDSFSFNGTGVLGVLGPYGMAETLALRLGPGASVFVQGMSMDTSPAVPELSTWAYGIAGFGLMGLLGWRKRRTARFAV